MSYLKLAKEKLAFIDCDDTLILHDPELYGTDNEKYIIYYTSDNGQFRFLPHFKNINFVRFLKEQGHGIVIWSAGGQSWAEKVVELLGIQDLPDLIISKPNIAVDDTLRADRIIEKVVWIDPITGEYKRNE